MAFQVLGDTVIDQNQIITSPKLILEGTSASESILSGSLNGDSKLEVKVLMVRQTLLADFSTLLLMVGCKWDPQAQTMEWF